MPRRPSPGNISSPYGMRWHPIRKRWQMHNGEDIGWGNNAGTTLVAPQRAQLIDYRDRGDWGRQARLLAGNVEHRLSHTARLVLGVDVGEWLDEGEPVAVMGMTGLADGVHVHWEVLIDGRYVDPAGWLADVAGKPQPTPEPEPEPEDTDMRIFRETNGSFFLAKAGGIVGIRGTADLRLLRRLLNSKPGDEDTFNAAERDIIASYMRG